MTGIDYKNIQRINLNAWPNLLKENEKKSRTNFPNYFSGFDEKYVKVIKSTKLETLFFNYLMANI